MRLFANNERFTVRIIMGQVPITYGIVLGFWVTLGILNGLEIVSHSLMPPLSEKWLELTQPVTDFVARLAPAIDAVSARMRLHGYTHQILFFRNVFAFNSIALMSFYLVVAVALAIELRTKRHLFSYLKNVCDGADRPIDFIARFNIIGATVGNLVLFFGWVFYGPPTFYFDIALVMDALFFGAVGGMTVFAAMFAWAVSHQDGAAHSSIASPS